ncbi:MAG TPA: DUF1707 and FHA domain-containing protein [Streptosporangiaceae bacterium]|nr:DUF1707 and FHA domain-containing protein [Streptosporangiaceae bacterium]
MVVPDDIGARGLDHIRISDAEREQALVDLRDGYAEGRLTHDTFGWRVDEVLRARASGELRSLVADLPRRRRIRAMARPGWHRGLTVASRWLRGWPPALTLPGGPQLRFTIGRESACDMTLADLTVSRWHASLQRDAGGWLLADLGSTNGTRLNGWRVNSPIHVRAGDLVSFGSVTFVLTERPGPSRAGT